MEPRPLPGGRWGETAAPPAAHTRREPQPARQRATGPRRTPPPTPPRARRPWRSRLEERAWIPMRVMLLKDVYKLGRAGDVKKVADGYGRNYLLPQGLGVLATPGALKQAERIRTSAAQERTRLNLELGSVAERLSGLNLHFPAQAGETGKLYGSITSAMIVEAIAAQPGGVR